MQPIEFACPGLGPLRVMGERLHDGHDFVVRSNAENSAIDYLLFLDSRGISREFEHSLADKMITRISQMGKTYLCVCRPLELTIWATLIGFLALNKLNPAKIIVNMGFVDFTPKKQAILQDAVRQAESVVAQGVAANCFVEDYVSAGGGVIPLYAMRYDEIYRRAIEAIAERHDMVILNTPLTDPGIAIERKRPVSFFPAQAESNAFNRSIRGAQVIDLPDFDETLTYDAVHFTRRGNELIFDRLKDYL
jgi:hypothetical protein